MLFLCFMTTLIGIARTRISVVIALILPFFSLDILAQYNIGLHLMRGFPAMESGYEKGVSACFAGAIGRQLVMAGGCNFPDIPAADGGKKRYYKGIYAAKIGQGDSLEWRHIGDLPVKSAYGVAITWKKSIICIGGNNASEALNAVVQIKIRKGEAVVTRLPSLPCALDNMTGSVVGNCIYVAGGNRNGIAVNTVLCLNLEDIAGGWHEIVAFPGSARVQPVSGGFKKSVFKMWGGFAPRTANKAATLSMNGVALAVGKALWYDLPAPVGMNNEEIFLGGAASVMLSDDRMLAIGGVNSLVFLRALNEQQTDYLRHDAEWYKFNPHILLYEDEKWHVIGTNNVMARAGSSLVRVRDTIYIIGGELMPGVRTPTVYRMKLRR